MGLLEVWDTAAINFKHRKQRSPLANGSIICCVDGSVVICLQLSNFTQTRLGPKSAVQFGAGG